MNNIKEIIWDFDGVILFSDEVREFGFRKVFESHSAQDVEQLIAFHNLNGGLSRYVKIRYFYETILNQPISDDEVNVLAEKFSIIMKEALVNKKLLNPQWLHLMKDIHNKYVHSIASGSDKKELNFLCKALEINHYFKTIEGSPTPKNELVRKIIADSPNSNSAFVLIGDAINDRDAAKVNNINFIGYRHKSLQDSSIFIEDLSELPQFN